jgi:glycosyltransferase involved in cell wall biosynthesis
VIYIHVIDEFRVGGAQTHLLTMLRGLLPASPAEHHVVCLFGDGELSGEFRALGIQVHILDLRPYIRQHRFLAASRELQQLFERLRPQVVEAHLTWSRFLGLFAAWRAGVPRRIGFEQGDIYFSSWKFRLANFVAQFFAHHILVCSHALKDWVHRTHGVSRSKLVVLHNCVDLQRFSLAQAPAGDMSRAAGMLRFCAVGTLGRGVNKRVDVLIRGLAVARSEGANAELLVCGDGDQRQELEALAASLGLASHVRFLGTRSDVAQVLRGCDVFVHAAPFEPFGIVAIEAMAAMLPIIVPNAGGIREAVIESRTGLLYPALDHVALGRAMAKLAADPQLRASMGVEARRLAESSFSSEQYISRMIELYRLPSVQRALAVTS